MRHYKLSKDQSAAYGGFTDLYVVTRKDLTKSTSNTDEVLTLDALEAGDYIGYEVLLTIEEEWSGNTADNALSVSVGITGAPALLLPASPIVAAGSPTSKGVGFSSAATGAPTPIAGATSLIMTFDITDTDGALTGYSSGKLHLWVKNLRRRHLEVAV